MMPRLIYMHTIKIIPYNTYTLNLIPIQLFKNFPKQTEINNGIAVRKWTLSVDMKKG